MIAAASRRYGSMSFVVYGTTSTSPLRNFCGTSSVVRHTHSGPEVCCVPMPTAFTSEPPTCCTRIMFVVPEMPTGTPAVTTTRSPRRTSPACSADRTARSTSSSLLLARGMVIGSTPQ